jgi:hypothetical protein
MCVPCVCVPCVPCVCVPCVCVVQAPEILRHEMYNGFHADVVRAPRLFPPPPPPQLPHSATLCAAPLMLTQAMRGRVCVSVLTSGRVHHACLCACVCLCMFLFLLHQWSSGVILFIMLSGFPPFQHAKPGDWWFDRVRANQMHLFWQAHGRSCAFPEGAMGK